MKQSTIIPHALEAQYDSVFHRVAGVVAAATQSAARSVNALMTGAYWTIGRHIVEFEQSGEERAEYGANLIEKLATGMTQRYGRGFSRQNLWQMRQFSLAYPPERILQTASGECAARGSGPTRGSPLAPNLQHDLRQILSDLGLSDRVRIEIRESDNAT